MTTISTERDVITLVNVFTVKPTEQQRLVDVLAEAAATMKTIHGYVSSNLHKSLDGTKVVNYVQWESVKDFEAMLGNPEAAPHMREAAGIAENYEPDLYEVAFVDEAADAVAGAVAD